MILIAYDGSADAQTAIDHAARLMPGSEVTVLSVWEPLVEILARSGGLGETSYPLDFVTIDAQSAERSHALASEGAERATAAGLKATPLAAAVEHTVPQTIIDQAEALDAQAIVMGTRGLTGVKSLLLGSVSHAVVQHAHRPVLIVPSQDVRDARAAGRV